MKPEKARLVVNGLKEAGVEVELSYPGHEDHKYGSINNFLITKLTAE